MKKIVSWNVNGIRAIMKKDFEENLQKLDADIVCLQETKAQDDQVSAALFGIDSYQIYSSSAERKGYSGVAIMTKEEPIEITNGIGIEEHDQEGRVLTAEYEDFFLVNVYVPNSGSGLKRLDYRKQWDEDFTKYLNKLQEEKQLILCGDLNVCHEPIDIARPESNYNKSAGYTQDEIDGLDHLLSFNRIDTFRHLYPETVKYSWWSYRAGARGKNIGWRLDYFIVSENLISDVKDSKIHNEYYGSDHCPVELILK